MKRVLVHIKAQIGPREEALDFECERTRMFSKIEAQLRSKGAIARFNRIMIFIYPTAEQETENDAATD